MHIYHLDGERITLEISSLYKGVGEGGGGKGGGSCLPTFKSVGGTSGFVPPLFGRPNVQISLSATILWLKTQFFQNFLGSLRSPTFINQYFPKSLTQNPRIIFSYISLIA